MMKAYVSYFLSLLLPFMVSCSGGGDSAENRVVKVKVTVARPEGGSRQLAFPARVVSDREVFASFKVAGRIASVSVVEGQSVKAGAVIATLDATDYQVAFDAARAEYNSVKAEADRVIAMYNENATTANNYDKAVYGLQQITAKLSHARDLLAETRLVAPVSGVVKNVYHHGGEVVGAGMPVVEIVSDAGRLVEIKVPSADIVRRDDFSGYRCRFDVYPGREFRLRPFTVSTIANANQLYTIKLQFMPGQGELPAVGMATTVTIDVDGEGAGGDLWEVPSTALSGSGSEAYLLGVGEGELLEKIPVSIERFTSGGDAVVACGRDLAGVQIVSAGVRKVKAGERVEVIGAPSVSNVGGLL